MGDFGWIFWVGDLLGGLDCRFLGRVTWEGVLGGYWT